MTFRSMLFLAAAAVGLVPLTAPADWARLDAADVEIEIVGDDGHHALPQYPVERDGRLYRAYLEAEPGEGYAIKVRNRSGRRIGLVIAVDGRNIISGERSGLDSEERMYILGPYAGGEYRGWRTGLDQVNRFYFTDAPDSYAGRWGDYSAMGVIAVAAFAEERSHHDGLGWRSGESGPAPGSKQGGIAPRHHGAGPAEPGTGFGEAAWSPSRRVAFDAQHRPFARFFLKYEWRPTLCETGIARCGSGYRTGRFRDGERFAPYPPGHDRW